MICCRGMIITGPGLIAPAGRFLPSAALAVTAGVLAGEAGADVCSTWRQGCGSGSGLDPDSIRSDQWIRIRNSDPDPGGQK